MFQRDAAAGLRPHDARDELGVARDDLHAVAYWKAGRTNTEVDAEAMQRYTKAVADGLDLSDPVIVQDLEFA